MDILKLILDTLFSFKAYVMLPIFIFIIALAVRMKLGQAVLSALRLAVGFAGVFIVFDFFVENIRPAVNAIVEVRGLGFPVLDVGWPPLAAITWSSPIAPITILLVIGLNVLLLALKLTHTIYIDIWNYWHFALLGALLMGTGTPMWLALLAVAVIAVYTIKTGDWGAVHVKREAGLDGVTISPVSVIGLVPVAATFDWIWERIPGLRRLRFDPERQGTNVGLLGEPMVIGIFVGILLGLAADYDLKTLLELCVHIAAVMFLLPKAAGLIGEGMTPISDQLKRQIAERFPKRGQLYVALDTGIIMSNKSVIVTGLILMPIALLLALIIPGNRVLPIGDLPNLISVMSMTVLVSRGNVIRSVLTGIPYVAGFLWIASKFAGLYTRLSQEVGLDFGEGSQITAFTDGGNHLRYLLYYVFKGNLIAMAIIPVVLIMMYVAWRRSQRDKAEVGA